MAFVTDSDGRRYRLSVPYNGERFQVTRYGNVEDKKVDHVIVKENASGFMVKADEEDAVEIDSLCVALNAGEITVSVLEEKLNWYFEATQ